MQRDEYLFWNHRYIGPEWKIICNFLIKKLPEYYFTKFDKRTPRRKPNREGYPRARAETAWDSRAVLWDVGTLVYALFVRIIIYMPGCAQDDCRHEDGWMAARIRNILYTSCVWNRDQGRTKKKKKKNGKHAERDFASSAEAKRKTWKIHICIHQRQSCLAILYLSHFWVMSLSSCAAVSSIITSAPLLLHLFLVSLADCLLHVRRYWNGRIYLAGWSSRLRCESYTFKAWKQRAALSRHTFRDFEDITAGSFERYFERYRECQNRQLYVWRLIAPYDERRSISI